MRIIKTFHPIYGGISLRNSGINNYKTGGILKNNETLDTTTNNTLLDNSTSQTQAEPNCNEVKYFKTK